MLRILRNEDMLGTCKLKLRNRFIFRMVAEGGKCSIISEDLDLVVFFYDLGNTRLSSQT